jgi:hypothetical protein
VTGRIRERERERERDNERKQKWVSRKVTGKKTDARRLRHTNRKIDANTHTLG